MIQREKENNRTDQAWNRLYRRLDHEGQFITTGRRIPLRSAVWKGASAVAAVIFLCVCFSLTRYFTGAEPQEQNLLTQQNSENTTLVTTLEDGSVVYLAGMTSLQYPKHFSSERREVSLTGSALFDITGNRARPFLIETKEAKIEVLGTAFDVRSDAKAPFALSVQRGEVKVTLKKNGQNIYVKAGETVTLLSQQLHLSTTGDSSPFARYTESMRFKDERLADILRIINLQEQDLRLQTSATLGERLLTVTFSNNSPESVAQLICLALNLKCTRDNKMLILSE